MPIIDITDDHLFEEISGGLSEDGLIRRAESKIDTITSRLTNVGKGPAFNLRYQVVHSDKMVSLVEPTFLAGHIMDSAAGSHEVKIAPEKSRLNLKVEDDENKRFFIRIRYQDTYGNEFESSKGLVLEKTGGKELLIPLRKAH